MGTEQNKARSELFRKISAQQQVMTEQNARIESQGATINRQAQVIHALTQRSGEQAGQIATLARGLHAVASGLGAQALKTVTAAMTRSADVQNPAQPIPEPPAQPAPFSTQDAKTPEAMESPQSPGLVPGSTNDVAADATTTVYQPGTDIPNQALNDLIDVTTPVDGTQGPGPLNTVRTETDIRVGDPNNQSQAFPARGPFANQPRLSSQASAQSSASDVERRTYASLRLVAARAATGDEEASGNQHVLAQAISRDASRSTEAIEEEATTLERVSTRMGHTAAAQPPRGLVPRQASAVPRSAPSMRSEASYAGHAPTEDEMDASDIFA